jgi:hypothetical protein
MHFEYCNFVTADDDYSVDKHDILIVVFFNILTFENKDTYALTVTRSGDNFLTSMR